MLRKRWKNWTFRLNIAINILLGRRNFNMILVFILALDMGLITKDVIQEIDQPAVYEALKNIDRLDLWED